MSADQLFVKMCGLRDATAARVAVQAGADALGFILAPSKRQVAPQVVRAIRDELVAGAESVPTMVGVVVNATPEAISTMVDASGVDVIQLAGDESPDVLPELNIPVIKAFRFEAGTTLDAALRLIDPWVSAAKPVRFVHVEGHTIGQYGGTGTRADWDLVRQVAERFPVMLAGGLDPENVADAVAKVQPNGVDVSSGTETDGAKDPTKIRAFVSNARLDAAQSSR